MSLALLFPGQGSQQPNMLRALPDTPAVGAVLRESRSQCAKPGVTDDIDSTTALEDTTNVQMALLIAGVACAHALTEDFGLTPRFVAGHSVGAFAAAVTAGVLTLPEALSAVALRGRLMEAACAQASWGMAAVSGLPTRAATQLAQHVSTDNDPLWVANINTATQTVLSGTSAALQKAAYAAEDAGAANYQVLDVSVASHCPLQADTANRLAAHLAHIPRRTPSARYLTNTRGRAVVSADAILDDLAQAVARPVHWYDAARLMPELGVTCAIETPPGHALTRLFASAAPNVTALALQDEGIDIAAARARRAVGRAN